MPLSRAQLSALISSRLASNDVTNVITPKDFREVLLEVLSAANLTSEPVRNASSASLSLNLGSGVETYLVGSTLAVPAAGLKIGSSFHWRFSMQKSGVGTAAGSLRLRAGPTGDESDPTVSIFTKKAGTSAIDAGIFDIVSVVQSLGASAQIASMMVLMHDLSATGFATTPNVVQLATGTLDLTQAGLKFGITYVNGANDSYTCPLLVAELVNTN